MPASYKVYQKAVTAALPRAPDSPMLGELEITLECVCKPVAKSKFTTPIGDVDNIAKGILDTMTDCGWWGDDRQITRLDISKRFPGPDETPHVKVRLIERDG
jgi:Holliday junction resolvase RusA-like endonuclease